MPTSAAAPARENNQLVEGLFQARRVHLIVGPSGAGKSRWMLPMMRDWSRGLPVLSRASVPQPFGYLVCDRPAESAVETIESMGMPADFPIISLMETQGNPTIDSLPSMFPEARVIFVEALAALMPGKMNDYQDVLRFFRSIYVMEKKHNVTLIGSIHTPKLKLGEEFIYARDNVLGSAGWAACSDTIILVAPSDPKDLTCTKRKLTVMLRNGPAEIHDLDFDANSRLVLSSTLPDWRKCLNIELGKMAPAEAIPTALVMEWADQYRIPERSAKRWITESLESGMLKKLRQGMYCRPFAS